MTDTQIREALTGIDKDLVNKFIQFHNTNPAVYGKFTELSEKMLSTGKKSYGARTVIEIIRWEHDLNTVGDVFRFNNDFSPLYARILKAENPVFEGFFELRKMKAKRNTSWEELKKQGLA